MAGYMLKTNPPNPDRCGNSAEVPRKFNIGSPELLYLCTLSVLIVGINMPGTTTDSSVQNYNLCTRSCRRLNLREINDYSFDLTIYKPLHVYFVPENLSYHD